MELVDMQTYREMDVNAQLRGTKIKDVYEWRVME